MPTQIYSYSGSVTDTNQYMARNKSCQNFFNDMAVNVPTGWALVTSSIPAPSSSAHLAYSVTFSYLNFQIKIYVTADLSSYIRLDILNAAGTSTFYNNNNTAMMTTHYTGSYVCDISMTLTRYYLAANYDVFRMTSSYMSLAPGKTFGLVYLTNKAPGAADYVLFSDFNMSGSFFTPAGTMVNLFGNTDFVYNSAGQYMTIDAYLYGGTYYGQMLNCKLARKTTGSTKLFPTGQLYTIDGATYLTITLAHDLLLKVSEG